MIFPFILVIFYILASFVRLQSFYLTFSVILLTPILSYPLFYFLEPSIIIYLLVPLILIIVAGLTFGLRSFNRVAHDNYPEIALFLISFAVFLVLAQSWADFYQTGERLRDYALLGSNIRDPFHPNEPWAYGISANYYLYWYRFGNFISKLGGLSVADTYHTLSAFCFSFLLTSVFAFCFRAARLSVLISLFISAVTTVGSNVKGVLLFISPGEHWWTPSRVIEGTINEFPAWSFLLGDLHPHFCNYGILPFILGIFFIVIKKYTPNLQTLTILSLLSVIGSGFLFVSNAWELPIFMLSIIGCLTYLLIIGINNLSLNNKLHLTNPKFILILVCAFYTIFSLWCFASNIHPQKTQLTLLSGRASTTRISELFLHWGIPLSLISLSIMLSMRSYWSKAIFGVILSTLIILNSSSAVIFLLLSMCALIIFTQKRFAIPAILSSIGLAAILFCEVFFFDDPYGGPDERMNTVFKFYASSWFFLNAGAYIFIYDLIQLIPKTDPYIRLKYVLSLTATFVLLGFFCVTTSTRQAEAGLAVTNEGLGTIEAKFPGASTTIRYLSSLPFPKVILEAQGGAYSYTAHVATLSSQPAYLGWTNHLNVLLNIPEEISRRESITKRIYGEEPCEMKRTLAMNEKINIIIVGDLERKAYGDSLAETFSCFEKQKTFGSYRIITVF